MKKEHYGAEDGLRTLACIGIVMMHIATAFFSEYDEIKCFAYQ